MSTETGFTSKKQAMEGLTEIFNIFNEKLSQLNAQQVSNLSVHKDRTIKDDVAHLYMWQRVSIARMEAALKNTEPELGFWPKQFNPESKQDLDSINEWIYLSNIQKTWSDLYKIWKENFLQFLKLAEKIDEKSLLQPSKFTWLKGYPLIAVLYGSYNHHKEHLEKITKLIHD